MHMKKSITEFLFPIGLPKVLSRRKKGGSLLSLFLTQALIISAIIISIFFAVFIVTFRSSEKTAYENAKAILEIYNESVSENLKSDIYQLYRNVYTDSDLASVLVSRSSVEVQKIIATTNSMLQSHLSSESRINGSFVYIPGKDIIVANTGTQVVNSPYANSKNLVIDFLLLSGDDLQKWNNGKWFPLRDNKSGQNYLFRIIYSQGIYTGNWYALDELTRMDYLQTLGASSSYLTMDGEPLHVDFPNFSREQVEKSLEKPISVKAPDGTRCVLASLKLSYCDCYLASLIPKSSFLPALRPFLILLGLMVGCLVMFLLFILRASSRVLKMPERSMGPILSAISEGEFDLPAEGEEYEYEETRALTRAYRTLAGEIKKLEADVYEEQLMKRDFELRYLKNQIAPHFLINCLNSIFFSAQIPDNEEVTGQMITTLTDHLRYSLTEQTTVSLGEELEHLRNYLELTQFRFPETLSFSFEVDDGVKDATVFPLILVTLSENSIKTGLVMGEPFRILVNASGYEKEGRRWVHIAHTDSGTGGSPELLQKFNNILHHFEVTEKGTGIGLYNTVSRLKLILGDEAVIHFSNADGMGLCVEYDIPYSSYFPFADIGSAGKRD